MDDLNRFRILRDQTRFGEGGEAVVWETRGVTREADLSGWRRGRLLLCVVTVVGGFGDGGVENEG